MSLSFSFLLFFFFNDTATTEIYTLSLHDALPISATVASCPRGAGPARGAGRDQSRNCQTSVFCGPDRKSTRLNSSHSQISYAVFCLKKKKKNANQPNLGVEHNTKVPPVSQRNECG